MSKHRVAAVQMASGPNVGANLDEAARLIRSAVEQGAELVALPENFALMGKSDRDNAAIREPDGTGPVQGFLAEQARAHGIWLVGGTVPLESPRADKVRAACMLFDPKGKRVARYDKIHLFDVAVGDAERYTESRTIDAGDRPVLAETPLGVIGLAACYDLRFPELFRLLVARGMEMLVLPSAFTAVTGKAHWEVLVRARAIENLSYVIAPGQGGFHVSGRETWGDSLIVDPWGTVLARLPKGPGVVAAEIDRARLKSLRERFPAIRHMRLRCEMP